MKQKSSYQELIELVASHAELKSPAELVALHEKLMDLREGFKQDSDLLESVIGRVEDAIRGRR